MKPTRHIIVAGMTLTLAFGMTPTAALAAENPDSEIIGEAGGDANDLAPEGSVIPEAEDYDKADYYAEGPEEASPIMMMSLARVSLISVSDDMKYFAYYESGNNYAQTLSYYDGYNALGFYQFDRRYGLVDFMQMCLDYDASTYSMFSPLVKKASLIQNESLNPFVSGNKFTALGNQMNEAWKAAYNANPAEFAALQDTYAYQEYYVPVVNRLATLGIDLEERADCVKGLMWGAANLFGPGSYGYDNGICYFLTRADLDDSMSDAQIVTAFCDSVINNIKSYAPGQPQYWEGWINRYKNEKQNCLNYLAAQEDSLSYNANGGSGKMSATNGTVNKSVKVAACSFTRDGYEFTGWNTKKDGSGKSYAAGSNYTLTEGDDVLYAQWKKKQVVVPTPPAESDDAVSDNEGSTGSNGSVNEGSTGGNESNGSGDSNADNSGSSDNGSSDNGSGVEGDSSDEGSDNDNTPGDSSSGNNDSNNGSDGDESNDESTDDANGDSTGEESDSDSNEAPKPAPLPPSNSILGGTTSNGSNSGSDEGTNEAPENGDNASENDGNATDGAGDESKDESSDGANGSNTSDSNTTSDENTDSKADSDKSSTSGNDSSEEKDKTNDTSKSDESGNAGSDQGDTKDAKESKAADEDKETLLKTNDESAGVVAALVGGFALAFGVAAGTLRRILGRN